MAATLKSSSTENPNQPPSAGTVAHHHVTDPICTHGQEIHHLSLDCHCPDRVLQEAPLSRGTEATLFLGGDGSGVQPLSKSYGCTYILVPNASSYSRSMWRNRPPSQSVCVLHVIKLGGSRGSYFINAHIGNSLKLFLKAHFIKEKQ